MNIHKNARLTPLRREEMARRVLEGRLSKAVAARTYGVTPKVVARWSGGSSMADRSSRPKRSPQRQGQRLGDVLGLHRGAQFPGDDVSQEKSSSTVDGWVRSTPQPMTFR
jgi:hypothetical protein